MEFKHLQSFVEVVNQKSFTKAAEHLFLSQPTISAHIQQLEEELGKRLILRTTKSIEVTPKGQEVYDYAANILSLRDRIVKTCQPTTQKIIHLGASTIPSAYILPDILPEFGALFPDVYFAIHQNDSLGIVNELKNGLFDIGLIGMAVEDDQLACVPFCQDHMVIITPVNDDFLALKQKDHVPIHDLLKYPIIMREHGSGSMKIASQYLESIGISEENLNIVARMNDQESIKKLVEGGLGISIVSELAARSNLYERRILGFPLEANASTRNLYIIYRKNYIKEKHIEKFIQFVMNYPNTQR